MRGCSRVLLPAVDVEEMVTAFEEVVISGVIAVGQERSAQVAMVVFHYCYYVAVVVAAAGVASR